MTEYNELLTRVREVAERLEFGGYGVGEEVDASAMLDDLEDAVDKYNEALERRSER